jgi:hypothetical protein
MWQKLAAAMMENVVLSALKLVLVTLAMGFSPDIRHDFALLYRHCFRPAFVVWSSFYESGPNVR